MNRFKSGFLVFVDFYFWALTLIYATGGIRINGRLQLSYLNDLWIVAAALYLILRFAFKKHFVEMSYGKALTSAIDHLFVQKKVNGIKLPALALACLMIYSAVLFCVNPILNHYGFGTSIFDVGIIHHSVFHKAFYSNFVTPYLWDKDGQAIHYFPNNRLNFGLYLFAALYHILPASPVLLLLLQSVALLSGVLPLVLLSRKILKDDRLVFFPALLYFFWDPIHRMNHWEFHETPFVIPCALWAFYFLESGKKWTSLFFCLLAAMWREDGWLLFSGMSFYWGIHFRQKILGSLLSVAGLLVLPLHFLYLQKFLNLNFAYAYLGGSPEAALHTILTRPWVFLEVAFQPMNREFWLRLLLSSSGLFLFSGPAIFTLIPSAFELGLSQSAGLMGWQHHYVGLCAAPLFYCSIKGLTYFQVKRPRFFLPGLFLAVMLTQLSFNVPGQFRSSLHQLTHNECFRSLVEKIPTDPSIAVIAVDPVATHVSSRAWVSAPEPERAERDQSVAKWLVTPAREQILTTGLKAGAVANPKPWKIVFEACGWVVANRD